MSHNFSAGRVDSVSARQQPRRDERQREIIDHAIAMQMRCNTLAAVEYMKGQDVQATIIERVLGDPRHRRPPGDTAHAARSP